ncbi:MAG: hypothetical protein IJ770_03530, partial [Alphaproteobacteria bacterium]|nr:hypothetical protein [Alphaproteobacteria bacterium]
YKTSEWRRFWAGVAVCTGFVCAAFSPSYGSVCLLGDEGCIGDPTYSSVPALPQCDDSVYVDCSNDSVIQEHLNNGEGCREVYYCPGKCYCEPLDCQGMGYTLPGSADVNKWPNAYRKTLPNGTEVNNTDTYTCEVCTIKGQKRMQNGIYYWKCNSKIICPNEEDTAHLIPKGKTALTVKADLKAACEADDNVFIEGSSKNSNYVCGHCGPDPRICIRGGVPEDDIPEGCYESCTPTNETYTKGGETKRCCHFLPMEGWDRDPKVGEIQPQEATGYHRPEWDDTCYTPSVERTAADGKICYKQFVMNADCEARHGCKVKINEEDDTELATTTWQYAGYMADVVAARAANNPDLLHQAQQALYENGQHDCSGFVWNDRLGNPQREQDKCSCAVKPCPEGSATEANRPLTEMVDGVEQNVCYENDDFVGWSGTEVCLNSKRKSRDCEEGWTFDVETCQCLPLDCPEASSEGVWDIYSFTLDGAGNKVYNKDSQGNQIFMTGVESCGDPSLGGAGWDFSWTDVSGKERLKALLQEDGTYDLSHKCGRCKMKQCPDGTELDGDHLMQELVDGVKQNICYVSDEIAAYAGDEACYGTERKSRDCEEGWTFDVDTCQCLPMGCPTDETDGIWDVYSFKLDATGNKIYNTDTEGNKIFMTGVETCGDPSLSGAGWDFSWTDASGKEHLTALEQADGTYDTSHKCGRCKAKTCPEEAMKGSECAIDEKELDVYEYNGMEMYAGDERCYYCAKCYDIENIQEECKAEIIGRKLKTCYSEDGSIIPDTTAKACRCDDKTYYERCWSIEKSEWCDLGDELEGCYEVRMTTSEYNSAKSYPQNSLSWGYGRYVVAPKCSYADDHQYAGNSVVYVADCTVEKDCAGNPGRAYKKKPCDVYGGSGETTCGGKKYYTTCYECDASKHSIEYDNNGCGKGFYTSTSYSNGYDASKINFSGDSKDYKYGAGYYVVGYTCEVPENGKRYYHMAECTVEKDCSGKPGLAYNTERDAAMKTCKGDIGVRLDKDGNITSTEGVSCGGYKYFDDCSEEKCLEDTIDNDSNGCDSTYRSGQEYSWGPTSHPTTRYHEGRSEHYTVKKKCTLNSGRYEYYEARCDQDEKDCAGKDAPRKGYVRSSTGGNWCGNAYWKEPGTGTGTTCDVSGSAPTNCEKITSSSTALSVGDADPNNSGYYIAASKCSDSSTYVYYSAACVRSTNDCAGNQSALQKAGLSTPQNCKSKGLKYNGTPVMCGGNAYTDTCLQECGYVWTKETCDAKNGSFTAKCNNGTNGSCTIDNVEYMTELGY